MLIIDIQYFANIIYYKKLFENKYAILDKYENFRKMSFHNRCVILGANGPLTLSVPVEGGRDQKRALHEVRIANKENWQRRHWRSIVSAYNRSPWFEHYKDSLSVLYERPYELLADWNLACLEWSLACLKANLSWELSKTYQQVYTEPGVADLRGKITPRSYPAVAGESSAFTYPQVFSERQGFVPNLSVLDILFCEGGKEAFFLLKKI